MPPLRLISRLTVDGARPRPWAIRRIDQLAAIPREISSRSSSLSAAKASPARRRRDPSMEHHDPLNAGLVPPLQRPRDGRSTLPVLPSLPELSLLRRCEPYPCMQPHRTPPHPARLEDVASIS